MNPHTPGSGNAPRVSIVVITHDRCSEVTGTVARLCALPERLRVIVVDNASPDDTVRSLRGRFPGVDVVALPRNIGAAARNEGVARVTTPYVAFCDDDTWWAGDSLARACALLDAHPRIGVLSARLLVGEGEREDPACALMRATPLPSHGQRHRILGFFAGACVMRVAAFRDVGGYEPRLFIGGEEGLMALDLATRGWHMVFAPEVVCHHHPSNRRDPIARRRLVARNAVMIAWKRLSLPTAVRATLQYRTQARAEPQVLRGALRPRDCLFALRRRRVVPAHVEAMRLDVEAAARAHRAAARSAAPADGAYAAIAAARAGVPQRGS